MSDFMLPAGSADALTCALKVLDELYDTHGVTFSGELELPSFVWEDGGGVTQEASPVVTLDYNTGGYLARPKEMRP